MVVVVVVVVRYGLVYRTKQPPDASPNFELLEAKDLGQEKGTGRVSYCTP